MEVADASAGAYVGGADPNEAVSHDGNGDVSGPKSASAKTIGFSKILEVDLVRENLLQYLSLEDLKSLTLSSKDALLAVRNSKTFFDNVVFKICGPSLHQRVLDNCFYSWKKVRITHISDVVDYPAVSTISKSMDSVKSLSVDLHYFSYIEKCKRCEVRDFILNIIESSELTLEDLTLDLLSFGLAGIEYIRCPNLKRLNLSKFRMDDDKVETLLQNLPPLEELTVNVCLPSTLLVALQGRMSKLRELYIDIKPDWRKTSTPPRAIDWSTAADLKTLEVMNISLYRHYCRASAEDVEDFLVSIPAKPVRKIVVNPSYGEEVFLSPKLGEYISRFHNLTELSLRNLKGFGNDSFQSILQGCRKLKHLALYCLPQLTGFGLTGVQVEKRGVSLTDLKDLVSLSIQDCGAISLTTLLRVIQFEFLTSLYFDGEVRWETRRTPREVLLAILERNPGLTEVDLCIKDEYEYGRDDSLENEAKRLYPRIQQLRFLIPYRL